MVASTMPDRIVEYQKVDQQNINEYDEFIDIEIQKTNEIQLDRKFNWKTLLYQRIYILTWLPKYNKDTAFSDLIAGITLGLTMIPQAIAYAALANLPSQYGLYSAFAGSLVYVFFGTVKEVSIGPTSLMAVLTLQYTMDKPPEYTILLTFLAGCVELLMGLLRLGFIVDFISIPVTSAFTSATSIIIIGGQLKNLFGVKYSAKSFMYSVYQLITTIKYCNLWDCGLSLCCCIFLLGFRYIKEIKIKSNTKLGKMLKKCLWYLTISANALIVFITSFVAYRLWTVNQSSPFKLSGKVTPGVPKFDLPPFEVNNGDEIITFSKMLSDLGSGIIVIPLVAVLANVAIAKAFSTGISVDATQEMLTLGICNILGSCFKSMPTCGAFTRSAVSCASGVKTPLSGLYSAILTILALSLLTPYFYYIPSATLASVLVIAVLFMIDFSMPKQLWLKNRQDFYAWLATFLVCLCVGVEIGLLFGVIVNILNLLYLWARPQIEIQIMEIQSTISYVEIKPKIGLFFPAIDRLRENVLLALQSTNFNYSLVINCENIIGLDFTSAKGIVGLATDLENQKKKLILYKPDVSLQTFLNTKNTNNNIVIVNNKLMLISILLEHNKINISK